MTDCESSAILNILVAIAAPRRTKARGRPRRRRRCRTCPGSRRSPTRRPARWFCPERRLRKISWRNSEVAALLTDPLLLVNLLLPPLPPGKPSRAPTPGKRTTMKTAFFHSQWPAYLLKRGGAMTCPNAAAHRTRNSRAPSVCESSSFLLWLYFVE